MKDRSLAVMVFWEEEEIRDLLALLLLICVFDAGFQFSNSLIASGAWISRLSTHSLSESGYPFHLTRYCRLCVLPNCRESRIFLTSYSSSLLTKSGGGLE